MHRAWLNFLMVAALCSFELLPANPVRPSSRLGSFVLASKATGFPNHSYGSTLFVLCAYPHDTYQTLTALQVLCACLKCHRFPQSL